MVSTKGIRLRGVECTECGSLYTGVSSAGVDANGTRLRRRSCKTCGNFFTTIEVPIPYDFHNTDTTREPERVRVARKSKQYFELFYTMGDDRHPGTRGKTMEVRAKLIIGKRSKFCYSGRHVLEGDNVYRTPKGKRYCRSCIREREKVYYQANRDTLNQKRRERKLRNGNRVSEPTASQADHLVGSST